MSIQNILLGLIIRVKVIFILIFCGKFDLRGNTIDLKYRENFCGKNVAAPKMGGWAYSNGYCVKIAHRINAYLNVLHVKGNELSHAKLHIVYFYAVLNIRKNLRK